MPGAVDENERRHGRPLHARNGTIDLTLVGFVLEIGAILSRSLSRPGSTEGLVDRLRGMCFDDKHRIPCSVRSISNLMISGPARAYRRTLIALSKTSIIEAAPSRSQAQE